MLFKIDVEFHKKKNNNATAEGFNISAKSENDESDTKDEESNHLLKRILFADLIIELSERERS